MSTDPTFWVFGYGSLMSDGWQDQFQCMRRAKATLRGYQRILAKPSITQWGTPDNPCPTMMLDAAAGSQCVGFAFEFSTAAHAQLTAYLRKREGTDFPLTKLPIVIEGNNSVEALVPIYVGTKRITATADELRVLISSASGTAGTCADYAANVARTLREARIEDRILEVLAGASAVGSLGSKQG